MEKGLKIDNEFGAFIIIGDSDMDTGRCADEPWQFQCTCTVVFPLENGAENHDITM